MSVSTARKPHRYLGSMLAIATAVLMSTALSGGTAFADPSSAIPARHHHHLADADHDGIPNTWERVHHTGVHKRDAKADPDHDGLKNLTEFHNHTLPHAADTDHDGLEDGAEVHKFHTNPAIGDGEDDADHDHIADGGEDGNWTGLVGTIISFDADSGHLLFETSIGVPVTALVTHDTRVRVCESCWTDDTDMLPQEGQDINALIVASTSHHGSPALRWLVVTCPPD